MKYKIGDKVRISGLAEEPRNLIPLIAKELGVEIGEEFLIKRWSSYPYKFYNDKLCSKTNGIGWEQASEECYRYLITANDLKIEKLPPKQKLNEMKGGK